MDTYDLLYGSADCFTDPNSTSALCEEETFVSTIDTAVGSILVAFLFCSVVGNSLLNYIFRVFNIVRREASVSHLCLCQMSLADLLYSVFVTPLSLSLLLSHNRYNVDMGQQLVGNIFVLQVAGFMGDVCRRASLLFITIVAADSVALIYLPNFHRYSFILPNTWYSFTAR